MNIKKKISFAGLLMILAFILYHCANPVSPTGGPKDVTAPGVVSSSPANNSVYFDKSRITITFDEFVKLKNPNQQVLISPPLDKKPEYRLRGKSLIIDLQEELMPNTTYTIFFGNAIVDITEENPLDNFLYAFSTGDHIDTLAIGGEVVNAFDLKPREGLFVMLFPPFADTVPDDSIPMLTRPLYVAKTDVNGQFQLRNLRDETYQLFALNDVNNNYLFDQPNEEIAFLDSLIRPEVLEPPKPDTAHHHSDTLHTHADSLVHDTLFLQEVYDRYYQMFMFQQVDSTQRLLGVDAFWPPKFRINYQFPAEMPGFEVVGMAPDTNWKIEQLNKRRDSLTVWVKNMSLDTLDVAIVDADTVLDTVQVVFQKPNETGRSRKEEEEEPVGRISIRTNSRGTTMDLGKPFRLIMGNPLTSWDFSTSQFIAAEDTMTGAPFRPADSIGLVFDLDYALEEGTRYEFIFPDSVFFSIYELTNDSLQAEFTTAEIRDYGNLILNLETGEYPYVVQLLDEKEKVLRETYITESKKLEWEFIAPGTYLVKAIQDKWRNRRWDTGIYTEKRQPENVYYFPAEIQVRANWDIEESWALPGF